MWKEITHKSSNSKRNILWRKVPSNRLLAYTRQGLIFYAFAKILVDTLDETRQTWITFFKLKALVDLEKFWIVIFSCRANDKSELRIGIFILSMISCVREKFGVIVLRIGRKKRQLESRNSLDKEFRVSRIRKYHVSVAISRGWHDLH